MHDCLLILDFIQKTRSERYESSEKSDNRSEGMALFEFHYKTVMSENNDARIEFASQF